MRKRKQQKTIQSPSQPYQIASLYTTASTRYRQLHLNIEH